MDDQGTSHPPRWGIASVGMTKPVLLYPGRPGRCHFCGRPGEIVSRFARRGYG
jgi:hypothetical protein